MALTVTGLNPASGPEGTHCVITGTEFTEDASRVLFGTYACGLNYSVISDTEISCVVPAGTGAVYVYVTTPAGTNAAGAQFTFAVYEGGSNNAPTITSVTPAQTAGFDGVGGDSVVIAGTYLTTTRAVFFGPTLATAVQASFTVNSASQVTAIAPPGEPGVQAYVFVETDYGTFSTTTTANDFLYQSSAIPTVTSLTPATALPGFEVTIAGTNFTTATAVRVGTLYAPFTIAGSTSIKFIVPGDATFLGTAVEVYVANFWGESTTHATLTYATAGTLKTALSLDTGTPAQSPRDSWIVTAGSVTATLTATYTPWSAETYVESKWYRLDGGANTKYVGTFAISGEGSHKVEFWSVGKDGVIEAANVRYVNIVASTTVTLTTTAALGSVEYRWTRINIPSVYYELYVDTTATPTTLACTTQGNSFSYKLSAGATGVYARVRAVAPDGTAFAYSTTSTQTVSLQNQTTDMADDAITLAKLAPGIQPPALYTGGSLPADFTDYPNGAILYWTNDSNLYKSTGSAWTKLIGAGDIIADTITAGQIAAGAIGATELAADSVYAKNLVVADFDNLVQNSNSEADPTGKSVLPASADIEYRGVTSTNPYRGSRCRTLAGAGTGVQVVISLCDPIPCADGDQFHIKAMARCGTDGGAFGVGVCIGGLDVNLGWVAGGVSAYRASITYGAVSYDYTVATSTVVYVQSYLICYLAVGNSAYVDDILFRKKMAGSLVVDGAITTAKLTVDGTMQAAIVTAGSINAVTINAVNITGGTIQGASVKTLGQSGATEIEMANRGASDASIQFWSKNAAEDFPGSILVSDLTTSARFKMSGVMLDGATRPSIDMLTGTAASDTSINIAPGGNASILLDNSNASGVGETTYSASKHTFVGPADLSIAPSPSQALGDSYDFVGNAAHYVNGEFVGHSWTSDKMGDTSPSCASGATDTTHCGVHAFTTGTAASTGHRMYTALAAFFTRAGAWCEFVFQLPYLTGTAQNVRLGFMDVFSTAAPTAGAWVLMSYHGGDAAYRLQAAVYNGSVQYSATRHAVDVSSWYKLRIEIAGDGHAIFTLWNDGTATTWNALDTGWTPNAYRCGHGFVNWSTATSAQNNLNLDYMAYYIPGTAR